MSFSFSSFFDLLKTFAPIILSIFVPGASVIVPLVVDAMNEAEVLHGAGTGAVKKAAVLGIVSDAVSVTNQVKGKTILDPVQTSGQVGQAIDLTISIINSIQKATASTAVIPPSTAVPVVPGVVGSVGLAFPSKPA